MMKYKELISKLTLEEKASLMSGKDIWQTKEVKRLGIPSITLSDGPHGVRRQVGEGDHLGLNDSLPATCFPTAATIANSWNPTLGEFVGSCLGEEARDLGVGVLLGPGMNMKRSPLCGRNFEYFSEDPYLAGKMAAGYVRGIQSKGVAACPKHFAVNNQELRRMASDSIVDERTLREIYLTAFEIAVKEGKPKSLMSSYNRINGIYGCEHEELLQDILVKEWGFDGFVVTDWGGSNDHTESVRYGNHLEMPATGGDSDRELVQSVKEGRLSQELLDQRVDELLCTVFEVHRNMKKQSEKFAIEQHHKAAERAAEESIVLLKNEDHLLPLSQRTKVAVIGDFAKTPRYQGAGSSVVNCTKLDSTLDVIKGSGLDMVGYEQGYLRTRKEDAQLVNQAVELAQKADVVLFYMGLDEISETEGLDRTNMKLPKNQITVLSAIATVNSNIVAVLSAGSSIEMPWTGNCRAIVHGYLAGQAGAGAILNVITGKVCPGGKLAETYPIKYEDTPAYHYFPGKEYNAEYREGLYIGYRYYDTAQIAVQFPFGFGLSYTTFAYSDLKVSEQEVQFVIKNTGRVRGAEIAQLYVVANCNGVYRPKKELKGFAKITLEPGESQTVSIALDDKAFRYYDTDTRQWEVESGAYEILIGASSADIRLSGHLQITGSKTASRDRASVLPSYYGGQIRKVEDREFEALLERKIPDGHWNRSGELQMNDALCQMFYAKSRFARLVYYILNKLKARSEAKGIPDLNILFIYNMPFRGIAKMTNGMVTMEMAGYMLEMVNGNFFRGLKKLTGAYFQNRKRLKSIK